MIVRIARCQSAYSARASSTRPSANHDSRAAWLERLTPIQLNVRDGHTPFVLLEGLDARVQLDAILAESSDQKFEQQLRLFRRVGVRLRSARAVVIPPIPPPAVQKRRSPGSQAPLPIAPPVGCQLLKDDRAPPRRARQRSESSGGQDQELTLGLEGRVAPGKRPYSASASNGRL